MVMARPYGAANVSRMSDLSTLPTFERGRSAQTSTCLGALTLPMRSLTNAVTSAGVDAGARPQLEDGGDPLAPLLVGQPDHGAVLDVRVRHQRLLDLGRVDVEAAGDDHVLGPVDDEQEAVVVEVADVAGVVPAVRRRLGGGLRVAVVAAPSPASCGRRSRRARRGGSRAPSSPMMATVTSGAGRPADDSRSWATLPSARKWSRGAIVEIIIGASVWPNSCAITGPIRVSASSSRAADIGAAPYQKHCSDERSVVSSASCASTM